MSLYKLYNVHRKKFDEFVCVVIRIIGRKFQWQPNKDTMRKRKSKVQSEIESDFNTLNPHRIQRILHHLIMFSNDIRRNTHFTIVSIASFVKAFYIWTVKTHTGHSKNDLIEIGSVNMNMSSQEKDLIHEFPNDSYTISLRLESVNYEVNHCWKSISVHFRIFQSIPVVLGLFQLQFDWKFSGFRLESGESAS